MKTCVPSVLICFTPFRIHFEERLVGKWTEKCFNNIYSEIATYANTIRFFSANRDKVAARLLKGRLVLRDVGEADEKKTRKSKIEYKKRRGWKLGQVKLLWSLFVLLHQKGQQTSLMMISPTPTFWFRLKESFDVAQSWNQALEFEYRIRDNLNEMAAITAEKKEKEGKNKKI